jgi:hypothetical protein
MRREREIGEKELNHAGGVSRDLLEKKKLGQGGVGAQRLLCFQL